MWAVDEDCKGNESVIECEIRLHNPSILFIVLGTNDIYAADEFEENMRARYWQPRLTVSREKITAITP